MTIGGFHKFSLIDYPEKISAVIFTRGCNFRCAYCHNHALIHPRLLESQVHEEDVLSFLNSRKGLLDGVVVSGGEPLLQVDIEVFIKEVRLMGYKVKLDTNGSEPERLTGLLKEGLIDYVAMDYKAPLKTYKRGAGVDVDTARIKKSLNMITESDIPYEVRTTMFSGLGVDCIFDMMSELSSMNVKSYFLQFFKPFPGCTEDLSVEYKNIERLNKELKSRFKRYGIRNIKLEGDIFTMLC